MWSGSHAGTHFLPRGLKHELLFAFDVAVRHLSAQSRLSISIHLASPGTLVRSRYVRQEAIQSLWDAFSEFQVFCLGKWLVVSRNQAEKMWRERTAKTLQQEFAGDPDPLPFRSRGGLVGIREQVR
jgi:hypothetical protein